MSETDSFMEEVSEEVRRDRLFGYLKRYGWIAVLAVLGLVGGAAYNEFSKAQSAAEAEARGDALLAALEDNDADAIGSVEADGAAAAVIRLLQSGLEVEDDDPAAAAAALQAVIDDADQPRLYRDLATLKLVILTSADTDPDARIAQLTALTTPGAAFRVLAEEQIALAEVDKGDIDAAVLRLNALLDDAEATQGLRERAQQMIIALGGDADPA
ncbi:MAG: tetratricopeptide repeat protein [Pseudomonadota bacterium]